MFAHMKQRCVLIFSAFLLLLSCSQDRAAIRRISQTLETSPEQALSQLDSLDRDSLSPRYRAQYDYLSATAFYRTYYFLDDERSERLASAYHYKELQRMRVSNLAMLITAVLATLVLYFWARKAQLEKQLLEKREENERTLSLAEDLKSRLHALQGSRKGSSDIGVDLLDRLFEQYYIYEGTENLQPKILKEVSALVDGLRSDPKAQHALEQSLDESREQVMTRLRAAFPSWKQEDYLLYLFTASGFSSATLSALLEKDKPYVYNRVYRLKERIKASEVPDKQFFLTCLERV